MLSDVLKKSKEDTSEDKKNCQVGVGVESCRRIGMDGRGLLSSGATERCKQISSWMPWICCAIHERALRIVGVTDIERWQLIGSLGSEAEWHPCVYRRGEKIYVKRNTKTLCASE